MRKFSQKSLCLKLVLALVLAPLVEACDLSKVTEVKTVEIQTTETIKIPVDYVVVLSSKARSVQPFVGDYWTIQINTRVVGNGKDFTFAPPPDVKIDDPRIVSVERSNGGYSYWTDENGFKVTDRNDVYRVYGWMSGQTRIHFVSPLDTAQEHLLFATVLR